MDSNMVLLIIGGMSIALLVLVVAAIFTGSKDKKSEKDLYKMLDELSAQVKDKNEALKTEIEKSSRLSEELNVLKPKLEAQNKKLEARALEDGETKKNIEKLKADILLREKQLSELTAQSTKSITETQVLKETLKKKEGELASLNEAYAGLREQYDDLDKQFYKLSQEQAAKSYPLEAQKNEKPLMKVEPEKDVPKT